MLKQLFCSLLASSFVAASATAMSPLAHANGIDYTITGSVKRNASFTKTAFSKGGTVDIRPASATLKRGLKALRKKDTATALAARKSLKPGTLERKVLAWAIAVRGKNVPLPTLSGISNDLAHWPRQKAMRTNIEKSLVEAGDARMLEVAFSQVSPESLDGAVALAKVHVRAGRKKSARTVISPFWRNRTLDKKSEAKIRKLFGSVLTKSDHRARVDYLLTKKRLRAAERVAGLAGATRLVAARAAVERKQNSAGAKLNAVPAFQRTDPNYLFSKARYLRRKNQLTQATKVLLSTSKSKLKGRTADHFWQEQRIVASDLVDAKKYSLAYKLAARSVASSATKRIDAEFYAGWIALRKIGDPATAALHFKRLVKLAGTPISISRGYYWLGRSMLAAGDKGGAVKQLQKAARYDTTYYGQLALRRLGKSRIEVSKPRPSNGDRKRFPKYELVQAIAKLESAGEARLARTFYRFLARRFEKGGELALLAARAERRGDYQLALQVGKSAFIRGRNVDTLAWPIGAISLKTKTSRSKLPLAYAISRQESTFQIDARSRANALGLMQLLPSTAKNTARKIGVRYSRAKLTTDGAYNAQLGTAYLSQQMKRFGGSYILTFVAYNAGPLRAQEWVERYGDPRGASLDVAIDWVEQIPYSETRNYVQRVMENMQVYNARINKSKLTIGRDLVKGNRI